MTIPATITKGITTFGSSSGTFGLQLCGATAPALDAGRTLLLDKAEMLAQADAGAITIEALKPLE